MDESLTSHKSNFILDFFKAWLYIFLYVFKGIKFVLLDMWVLMFHNLTFKLNEVPTEKVDIDAQLYDKTKNYHQKKVKQYKYSEKTLAKYAKMKAALSNDIQATGSRRSKVPHIYKYTVRNVAGDGKIFTDTMSGYSKLDINSFLVNEGYEVYSIETSTMIDFLYRDFSLFENKIKTKDLIFLLTQLATYLKSGITLNEAVKILTMQLKRKKTLYKMFRSISYELSLGSAFSDALAKQGTFFPPLLINMIKAAEATGTLRETLEDLAKYYTEVYSTHKEMVSALTYPAIITVFSIAVVTFIIVYVVPQFTKIYSQADIEVKGLTAFVIKLSGFLSNNLVTIILIFIIIMVLALLAYKKSKSFRIAMQMMVMHIPVIKDVIIYKELNIFAKTFASLLRNNVYITESMDILSKITNNEIYKAIMYQTVNNIVKGENISDAFKDHWAIPDVAYYMIVTGESTGELADMMQKVSDYYQDRHKNVVTTLKSFIEPIMIVFLAVMVALIILAVIVPMFQLYNGLI